jgi:hypothetical protein
VDLIADLDDVEKRKLFTLPGLELRSLGRLARSQSLYLLRYPSSFHEWSSLWIFPVPPGKFRESILIKPQPVPFKSFSIRHSSII